MALKFFLIVALLPLSLNAILNQECLKAYKLARKDHYTKAFRTLPKDKCSLLASYIHWLELRYKKNKASFQAHFLFLKNYPKWPFLYEIQKNMEQKTPEGISTAELLEFFRKSPPKTPEGMTLYAHLLKKSGKLPKAHEIIRTYWASTPLDLKKAMAFSQRHEKILRNQDHKARLEGLLWDGHKKLAKPLLKYLTGIPLKMTQLRLAFQDNDTQTINTLMKGISPASLQDEGLLYDQVKWYRRHREKKALSVYQKARPHIRTHVDQWIREKHIIGRDCLKFKHYKEAYELLSNHIFSKGSKAFAEAEWLAGFIAHGFLGESQKAVRHFEVLLSVLKKPSSITQAAYWGALAQKKLGNHKMKILWLKRGTAYPTTYYGQLCCEELGLKNYLTLKDSIPVSNTVKHSLARNPLVAIVKLLHDLGDGSQALPFLYLLFIRAKNREEKMAVIELAHQYAPHIMMELVDGLDTTHPLRTKMAYPTLEKIKWEKGMDKGLIHAIVRKESGFNPKATSWVGAMGMMQIMPNTGKQIAGELTVKGFKISKLHDKDLNLSFGQHYVNQLLKRFDNHKILTLAAYNAGHGTVERKWLPTFGDPRTKEIDEITWIELIPFTQTRFYVKKVFANYKIYNRRL